MIHSDTLTPIDHGDNTPSMIQTYNTIRPWLRIPWPLILSDNNFRLHFANQGITHYEQPGFRLQLASQGTIQISDPILPWCHGLYATQAIIATLHVPFPTHPTYPLLPTAYVDESSGFDISVYSTLNICRILRNSIENIVDYWCTGFPASPFAIANENLAVLEKLVSLPSAPESPFIWL